MKAIDDQVLINGHLLPRRMERDQTQEAPSVSRGEAFEFVNSITQEYVYPSTFAPACLNRRILGENVRAPKELLQLISLDHRNDSWIKELAEDDGFIATTLSQTKIASLNDSKLLPQSGLAIGDWTAENVQLWANHLKAAGFANDPAHLPEILAVINRANKLHAGFQLRDTQIISITTLLSSQKGSLAQIATGEGKSTIVAALAVINALRGGTVDVITSSPILAKRDADEKRNLYKMFGLSCSDNAASINEDDKKPKQCYRCDIVYGDVSNFQFDLLKDEFYDYGTKAGRKFGVCIVDEVDSMLIDEGSKIAKLSSPTFGMEYIEPLFVAVWQQLGIIENRYAYHGEELLWIDGDFILEVGEITLLGNTSEEDIYPVPDRSGFTGKLLVQYITSLLEEQSIIIPNHLLDFVSNQKELWAKSAINALTLSENRDYLIIENSEGEKEIAPVAYSSTGITQKNTQWSDGQHQFLQIKHSLKIKPEGLTSCFISNMGYFGRYGNKLYGMTGTLGSNDAQKLLQSAYDINLAFIPTYKQGNFQELEALVTEGVDQQMELISQSVTSRAKSGQSCLVICETIADAIDVDLKIKAGGFDAERIINYYRSDEDGDSRKLEKPLEPGYIIVATNLAGRGTDIRTTSLLEIAGGLHVCLAFLPSNKRVEDQAFGRTARCGNNGTGQMILNTDYEMVKLSRACPNYISQTNSIEDLKKWRDEAESLRLAKISGHKIGKLRLEDKLFNDFNRLVHELRLDKDSKYKIQQVEELWAFWFKKIADQKKYSEGFAAKAKSDFVDFYQQIKSTFADGNSIMQNPVYLSQQAFNAMGENGGYGRSNSLYQEAIKLDDKFTFAAHYNLGYSILRATAHSRHSNAGSAAEASRHLIAAKTQLEEYIIPAWQSMQVMLGSEASGSPLMSQLQSKIDLLQMQIRYIDNAIEVIANSRSDQIIRIKDPKFLDELFDSTAVPSPEIQELNRAGIHRLYKVEAVNPPKDWSTNFAIAVLGIAQVAFGVALTISTGGFAAHLGASIIAEGIKDVYMAAKASIEGVNLDWKGYWMDKAVSYAAVIVASGVASAREGARAATEANGVKGLTATSTITTNVAGEVGFKEVVGNVAKQAVITVAKCEAGSAIARGISNQLSKYRGALRKNAIAEVRATLEKPEIAAAVAEICAVDRFLNHVHGKPKKQELLERITAKLKSKEHRLFAISKRLVQATSGASSLMLAAGAGFEVAQLAKDTSEFNNIISEFCDDIAAEIKQMQKELKSTAGLLREKLETTEGVTANIMTHLQRLGIIIGPRSFSSDFTASSKAVMAAKARGKQAEPLPVAVAQAASRGGSSQRGITSITASTNAAAARPQTQAELKNAAHFARIAASQPRPFEYADLSDAKAVSEHASLFDSIDFGLKYRGAKRQLAIDAINNLCMAYSANYDRERDQIAESLGQVAGGAVAAKLQSAFIQPASVAVANIGIDIMHNALKEHNDNVRQRLLAQGGRKLIANESGGFTLGNHVPYSGVSASTDQPGERLTEADRQLQKEMDEMPLTYEGFRAPEEALAARQAAAQAQGITLAADGHLPSLSATGGKSMGEVARSSSLVPNLSDEQIRTQYDANSLKPEFLLDDYQKAIIKEFNNRNLKSEFGQAIDDWILHRTPAATAGSVLANKGKFSGNEQESLLSDIISGSKSLISTAITAKKLLTKDDSVLSSKSKSDSGKGVGSNVATDIHSERLKALDLSDNTTKLQILRGKDSKITGVEHTQQHHVIHKKLADHELWEKAGIDVEYGLNKMLLPTKKGAEISTTTRTIHEGRHFNRIREELETKMDRVLRKGQQENYTAEQYNIALKQIIQEERASLKSGERALNKNTRTLPNTTGEPDGY